MTGLFYFEKWLFYFASRLFYFRARGASFVHTGYGVQRSKGRDAGNFFAFDRRRQDASEKQTTPAERSSYS
jgi:hypothetical protein